MLIPVGSELCPFAAPSPTCSAPEYSCEVSSLSIFGTQSELALISPRTLYGISREGMLPRVLGRVHTRFRTPVISIWLTGVLVVAITETFTQLLILQSVAARLYST